MPKSGRRAVAGAAFGLIVLSVCVGLLVAAVALPVVGAAGVATKNVATTFNRLPVPSLGQVPLRSQILDSRGHLLAYYYPGDLNRDPVSYGEIAPVMRNAIVAIEDSRFYLHGALDPRGTIRALVNDLSHTQVQGGSTLAQQYVKNTLILTAPNAQAAAAAAADTTSRKIRELRMAVNVEHELTRHQLIAAYLNVAYFENHAYGVQIAAQRYFRTSARHLSLTQAAMLAGLVENPAAYDPLTDPKAALARRNIVLTRMAQLHYISNAQAQAAQAKPLGLRPSLVPLQNGCTSNIARQAAFFCDYVLAAMRVDKAYAKAYKLLNTLGGLTIHTTLNSKDERVANRAVNYIVPAHSSTFNPGHNVDAEVLIQPGTGQVRAIAIDRRYGTGPGETNVDYAVDTPYDGGAGVQTGSSSKLFTLLTALKQGMPFGWNMKVSYSETVSGYYNCKGQPLPPYPLVNAGLGDKGIYTLYNGTTQSINVFFAHLEQKTGLCNVVKTAASIGLHRADGKSLFQGVGNPHKPGYQYPADDVTSFTLGSVDVSPMSMAAAYATVAARGIYCRPIAITEITDSHGHYLPVESARCHRALSAAVADAANYVLQGVLTSGTASNRGINRPAAGKTGTANAGYYSAFAGYTPTLAGYASVFNPLNPTRSGAMVGYRADYREVDGSLAEPGQMYGDNAPAATWQMTFLHAALGPPVPFVGVPPDSPFFSMGNGVNSPKPPKKHKPPKKPGGGGHGPEPGGGGGNGGGGGHNHGGPPHD